MTKKYYPPECVEATGSASVDAAFVMMAGPMKTAAAPWKRLHVWPGTRCCAMVKVFANVGDVNVTNRMEAWPVRFVPLAWAHVRNTANAWSVGRSGLERRGNGEMILIFKFTKAPKKS